jgi:chromosome segregation ATPase
VGDLKKKKAELEQKMNDQTTLQKSVDGLKREVELLEKAVGEVERVVEEYKTGLPKLQQDRDALSALLTEHTKEVEAVLGPKAKQVRDEVDKIDTQIVAAQAEVTAKEQAWKTAAAEQATTGDAATAAEAEFAGMKQSLATEQKKLASATAIKELERKADADNDYKKKAYLLHDLDTALHGVSLIDSDKLRTNLTDMVDRLKQKKDAAAAAKDKTESAKRDLEAARQKQAAQIAGRSAAIEAALKTIG